MWLFARLATVSPQWASKGAVDARARMGSERSDRSLRPTSLIGHSRFPNATSCDRRWSTRSGSRNSAPAASMLELTPWPMA
jgi:hypothetical protein